MKKFLCTLALTLTVAIPAAAPKVGIDRRRRLRMAELVRDIAWHLTSPPRIVAVVFLNTWAVTHASSASSSRPDRSALLRP